MTTILPKISSSVSNMWLRVVNIEKSLFPALKEELRLSELSSKEQKLINILDFAEIEKNVTIISITNTPKDREEYPKGISSLRSGHSKSVYCKECL